MCGCVGVWVGVCVGVYTKSKTSELSPLRRVGNCFASRSNFLLRCVRKNMNMTSKVVTSNKYAIGPLRWEASGQKPSHHFLSNAVLSSFSRLVYDVCRCVVQFVMPLLVVLGVYVSIFCRLKNRPISQHSDNNQRRRRTNIMIISVSVIFFLSWLPLNTLNFLLDFKPEYIQVRQ
jgi:hypothetical protein